jgi:hypothetical protein
VKIFASPRDIGSNQLTLEFRQRLFDGHGIRDVE